MQAIRCHEIKNEGRYCVRVVYPGDDPADEFGSLRRGRPYWPWGARFYHGPTLTGDP